MSRPITTGSARPWWPGSPPRPAGPPPSPRTARSSSPAGPTRDFGRPLPARGSPSGPANTSPCAADHPSRRWPSTAPPSSIACPSSSPAEGEDGARRTRSAPSWANPGQRGPRRRGGARIPGRRRRPERGRGPRARPRRRDAIPDQRLHRRGGRGVADRPGAVGIGMPSSPRRAPVAPAQRARLRIRGLGFRERDVSQVTAEELARIDICWAGVAGLSMFIPLRGADFQSAACCSRCARGARTDGPGPAHGSPPCGDRWETGEVPAGQGSTRASDSPARRVARPEAIGMVSLARGLAAFLDGRWKAAYRSCDRAERVFRERLASAPAWEIDTVQQYCSGHSCTWDGWPSCAVLVRAPQGGDGAWRPLRDHEPEHLHHGRPEARGG